MQLKDVTPIIEAILDERDKIPRVIDQERYIPNPQPYHAGNFMRGGIRKALRIIEQAPVVEAVPVVHGQWVKAHGMMPPEYHHRKQCSMCGGWALQDYFGRERLSHYCPNCGAKMDGETGV